MAYGFRMTTTYDIPQPFEAIHVEPYGDTFWTVQATTPSGPTEWVLIDVGLTEFAARTRADLLNRIFREQ